MKTKFETDGTGRVTIHYDDFCGRRITREFTCSPDGGYVQELQYDGGTTQPCEGLAPTGATLIANSRETLIDIIRREYRKMRRWENSD